MKRTHVHRMVVVALGLLVLVVPLGLPSVTAMVAQEQESTTQSPFVNDTSISILDNPIEVLSGDNNYFLKIDLRDPRVHPRVMLANDDRGGYQSLYGMKNRLQGYVQWAIVNWDLFSPPSGDPRRDCPIGENCAQGLTYIDGQWKENWSAYGNTWPARGNIGFDESNNVQISKGGDQSKRYMVIAGGPRVLIGGSGPYCQGTYNWDGRKKTRFEPSGEEFDGDASTSRRKSFGSFTALNTRASCQQSDCVA